MSSGVKRFDPPVPRVMHTVTTVVPACAHLAKVPPTVNSWSSGWAWMLITRAGGAGSTTFRFFLPCSGTPGAAESVDASVM